MADASVDSKQPGRPRGAPAVSRTLGIGAFLLLSTVWYGLFRSPGAPGDDPTEAFVYSLLGYAILTGIAAVLAALAFAVRARIWRMRRLGVFASLAGSVFLGIAFSALEDAVRDRPLVAEMEELAIVLEGYRADSGAYPISLLDLVPNVLPALPASFTTENPHGIHEPNYSGKGDRFAICYWTEDWRLKYLTNEGWVAEQPRWMYPLSPWARHSEF